MALSRWFRVPHEDGIYDPENDTVVSGGPKYRDREGITGHTGTQYGNSPFWLVRFYGTMAALDSIEAEKDVTAYTEESALRQMNALTAPHLNGAGRPWDVEEFRRRFSVNP